MDTARNPKAKAARDYFDDDDDEPQFEEMKASNGAHDDDVDPLDAFMVNVKAQMEESSSKVNAGAQPIVVSKWQDDSDCDSENETSGDKEHERIDEEFEYDSDGIPVGKAGSSGNTKKVIEPLAPVDHSKVQYSKFRKNFALSNAELSDMSAEAVRQYRDSMEISVMGSNVPHPLSQFSQAGLPDKLTREILRLGFELPTAIQAQALPIVLSGRDLIGLAKTGSGKTFAFVWPMLVHILDQPQMQIGDGPIALILAPTRELVTQLYGEIKKFANKLFNIRVCAVFGGAGKYEMQKTLQDTVPEIVVATPGRFIEFAKNDAFTNLRRCTMVVLDEADRMFDLGFEYQMRSIVRNIRPDRQTLLFSATMKKRIEEFARDLLNPDAIRIVIGTIGQANPDIRQVVEVLDREEDKFQWLTNQLDDFLNDGKVLIFVSSKAGTELLCKQLVDYYRNVRFLDMGGIECMHGDVDQGSRDSIIRRFKATGTSTAASSTGSSALKSCNILIATDVASRGLDIKNVRTVINYEIPRNIETYIHRIGRTGRMGVNGVTPGTAFTLLLEHNNDNSSFAVDLVRNLQLSQQSVPPNLVQLAQSNPKWERIMSRYGGGANLFRSGAGGRAGIGSSGSSVSMTSAMAAAASAERYSGFHDKKQKFLAGTGSGSSSTANGVTSTSAAHAHERAAKPSRFSLGPMKGDEGSGKESQSRASVQLVASVNSITSSSIRRNRFSDNAPAAVNETPVGSSSGAPYGGLRQTNYAVSAAPMKGFVRASSSGTLHSVQNESGATTTTGLTYFRADAAATLPPSYSDAIQQEQQQQQRKKSRWS